MGVEANRRIDDLQDRARRVGGLPVVLQLDEGIAQFQRREVGPVDVFVELEAADGTKNRHRS